MTGLLSWLFGCAEPPSFDQVVEGRVTLEPSDRAAMDQLLASSGASAAEVRLLSPEETYGPEPYVRIDGARVTRLALGDLADAEPVGRLQALRDLSLTGDFEALALIGLEQLERVYVLSREAALQRLELVDLPSLTSLTIHGGDLPDDLDLRALPLRSLSLNDCRLASPPRVDPAGLTDLFLARNPLQSLAFLEGFDRLERLHLSSTGLETLDGLPPLPSLKALYLADNPLRPDVSLDGELFPKLSKIDLSRTGLRAAPIGLRDRESLRLEFAPGVAETLDFEATLARLRDSHAAVGELVTKVRSTSGTIRGSSGRCSWKTSVNRRARVNCELRFESVRGTAMARLGETDPAMPFSGGGAPRVTATLKVGEGEVAVYVRESYDLIATAKFLSDVDDEVAEAAAQPGDRFEGYRRVVARPGEPARVQGDVLQIGSRVVLLVESVSDEARDVELIVTSD